MFKDLNILEFTEKFSTDENCHQYLASIKWNNGYRFGKCDFREYYLIKKAGSRLCTNCKYAESATTRTLFHRQVMMFKSWLRGIHHHCKHLQGYLDEFCYRFNRIKYPETLFHKLVERMVFQQPLFYQKYQCA